MVTIRHWKVVLMLGLAVLLNGCGGGGGDSCESTGSVQFVYAPARAATIGQALTYSLNATNRWTLTIQGVNQACLTGLNVIVPADRPALPASVSLDATTGTLSTGTLTRPIEGECTRDGGTIVGPSTNRSCPAGQVYQDIIYALLIRSDRVNMNGSVLTPISFAPAP